MLNISSYEDYALRELKQNLQQKKDEVLELKTKISANRDNYQNYEKKIRKEIEIATEQLKQVQLNDINNNNININNNNNNNRSPTIQEIREKELSKELEIINNKYEKYKKEEEITSDVIIRLSNNIKENEQKAENINNYVDNLKNSMFNIIRDNFESMERVRRLMKQASDNNNNNNLINNNNLNNSNNNNNIWSPPTIANTWTTPQKEIIPNIINIYNNSQLIQDTLIKFSRDIKDEIKIFSIFFKGEIDLHEKLIDEINSQKEVLISVQFAIKNISDNYEEDEEVVFGLNEKIKELTGLINNNNNNNNNINNNYDENNNNNYNDDENYENIMENERHLREQLEKETKEVEKITGEIKKATIKKEEVKNNLIKTNAIKQTEEIELSRTEETYQIMQETINNNNRLKLELYNKNQQIEEKLLNNKILLNKEEDEIKRAENKTEETKNLSKTTEIKLENIKEIINKNNNNIKNRRDILTERSTLLKEIIQQIKTIQEEITIIKNKKNPETEKEINNNKELLFSIKKHNADTLRDLHYISSLLPERIIIESPLRSLNNINNNNININEYFDIIGTTPEIIRKDAEEVKESVMAMIYYDDDNNNINNNNNNNNNNNYKGINRKSPVDTQHRWSFEEDNNNNKEIIIQLDSSNDEDMTRNWRASQSPVPIVHDIYNNNNNNLNNNNLNNYNNYNNKYLNNEVTRSATELSKSDSLYKQDNNNNIKNNNNINIPNGDAINNITSRLADILQRRNMRSKSNNIN